MECILLHCFNAEGYRVSFRGKGANMLQDEKASAGKGKLSARSKYIVVKDDCQAGRLK